jgi:hypothetical protein
MFVYNTYNYTGGHTNKAQAHKTNLIWDAICKEIAAHPRGPTCVCGDLNAEPGDIPILSNLLAREGWVDLGAKAQIWGQPPGEYTCITSNTKIPTRRDYVFVNPDLFPMITNFCVDHDEIYPTHATLRFRVSPDHVSHHKSILQRPLPLHELLDDHFQRTHDIPNMSITEINTQRSIHRAQFQLYLDHCMMSKAPAFKSSEMGHCAATYWQHWRTTVEEAFTGFVEMDDVPRGYDRRAYLGHGIIKVKEVDVHGSPRVNFKRGSATPSSAPAAVRTLTQQCTRLRQWADRVMVQ